MRKLARIVKIDEIIRHENADQLEIAKVGGWKVVVRKGEFQPGDFAVYFEIDSWIPREVAPFLCKEKERVYKGVVGEKLKTVRLRGELSQGLLIPVTSFGETIIEDELVEDYDLTEKLGIQKWEPNIPSQLAGVTRGNFPSFIPKTDQERIQNLTKYIDDWLHIDFETTIKLDGSSITIYYLDESRFGVCSRNLYLKLDQEGNAFIDTEKKYGILDRLRILNKPLAIQGELCGPGIQGNNEKLTETQIFIFDVYDIQEGKYLTPADRYAILEELGLFRHHVPILETNTPFNMGLFNVDDYLWYAEGYSYASGAMREGVVFKSAVDGNLSFKAINNQYLLKNKDR